MAPFPTATTMVACLNFSLSQISDHYRLNFLTVAKLSKALVLFEKISALSTGLIGKASIAWLISSVAPAGKIPRGAVRSKEDLVQTKIIQTEF